MSGSLLLSAGWSTASSTTHSAMRTAATAQPSGAYNASCGVHFGTCCVSKRSPGRRASLSSLQVPSMDAQGRSKGIHDW